MCVHASVGLRIELDCLLVLVIPPLVPSLFLFYQIFKTQKRGVKKIAVIFVFWGFFFCFVIIRYSQNFQQMHIDIKPVFSSFLSFIMIQINNNPEKNILRFFLLLLLLFLFFSAYYFGIFFLLLYCFNGCFLSSVLYFVVQY